MSGESDCGYGVLPYKNEPVIGKGNDGGCEDTLAQGVV